MADVYHRGTPRPYNALYVVTFIIKLRKRGANIDALMPKCDSYELLMSCDK